MTTSVGLATGSALLLVVLILPAHAATPAERDAARAIRKVLDEQVTAWNKGDLEGYMAGYWKSDQLTFYAGKDRTAGWKATLERYRNRYQGNGKEMGKVSFDEVRIELLGPTSAFVRGRWRLAQRRSTLGGLFTLIFRKTANGWKIVHDHTSGG